MISRPLSLASRRAFGPGSGRLGLRLSDRDEAQAQRRSRSLPNPNLAIDTAALALLEQSDEIHALTVRIEPSDLSPAGADDDVGAGRQHGAQGRDVEIAAVGNADLALDDGRAIEPLSFALVCQLEGREAVVRQIERGMDTPDPAAVAAELAGPRYGGGIDQPDRPSFHRNALRQLAAEQIAHERLQPRRHAAQAAEQRDVGKTGKTRSFRPRDGRSQARVAQTLRKCKAQKIHTAPDRAGAGESVASARARLERLGASETANNGVPVGIQQ